MLNAIASIFIAAFGGALYFTEDDMFLAASCLIIALLFSIGYFDIETEQKKSVK